MAGDTITTPNRPPAIRDFRCQDLGGGVFVITGRVDDESPGGLQVTLGGSTSAAGQSTTTLSDGSFTMTVTLRTNGTDAGHITATTRDNQGLQSETVSQYVEPTP